MKVRVWSIGRLHFREFGLLVVLLLSAMCPPLALASYCDNNTDLLFCEDFEDGTFGNVWTSCNSTVCNFLSHRAVTTGGYVDQDNGIDDSGSIRTTILAPASGQGGAPLGTGLINLPGGTGSFGFLIKAGPSFWSTFKSVGKFIAFRPAAGDPREISFIRTAGGCSDPSEYIVLMASGGGGAAINFDEFGNSNPWDSGCSHSLKFGDNLANLWVYIEWEIHSSGTNRVYAWLQDGTQYVAGAPVTSNTTQQSVELFHYIAHATTTQPNAGSYANIDLFRVNNEYMGPPPGFLEGNAASPTPPTILAD